MADPTNYEEKFRAMNVADLSFRVGSMAAFIMALVARGKISEASANEVVAMLCELHRRLYSDEIVE